MKRLFVILILFLSFQKTSTAYDFELDGLRYITINDSSVTVVHLPDTYNGWKVHYKGDIIIPKTVTYSGKTYTVPEIGHEAFFECYELTSITIPNTVTLIETRAFSGCSGLTSVKSPTPSLASMTTLLKAAQDSHPSTSPTPSLTSVVGLSKTVVACLRLSFLILLKE